MHTTFIVGRVGGDPKPIGTGAGRRFSIATDEWNSQKGERETTWSDCVAFGKTAEKVDKHVTKGRLVAVRARYTRRKYQDRNGAEQEAHSFLVDHLELLPDGRQQQQADADSQTDDLVPTW